MVSERAGSRGYGPTGGPPTSSSVAREPAVVPARGQRPFNDFRTWFFGTPGYSGHTNFRKLRYAFSLFSIFDILAVMGISKDL